VISQANPSSARRDKPQVCIEEPPKGIRSAIYAALGLLLQICIEGLVRLTGRPQDSQDRRAVARLCTRKAGVIGGGVYQRIGQEENLELSQPPDAGLIEDFAALRGPSFDPDQVDPRVRHSTNAPHCIAWKSGAKSTSPANSFSGCSWNSSAAVRTS
jgi:hypothetical protein